MNRTPDKTKIYTLNNLPAYISSRNQLATAVAIIFHTVGLVGILLFKSTAIINATPLNLLLSFALLWWTHPEKDWSFYLFIVAAFLTGFVAEVIGVNTGNLFGIYSYGKLLGIQYKAVPFIIGVNWFIVMYCCGSFISTCMGSLMKKLAAQKLQPSGFVQTFSVISDSAMLAVLLDWLMEPVAVSLGFWTWGGDGTIPFYNYLCWFVISLLLMALFHLLPFHKKNIFAVNLLLVQSMFFLLLRIFL